MYVKHIWKRRQAVWPAQRTELAGQRNDTTLSHTLTHTHTLAHRTCSIRSFHSGLATEFPHRISLLDAVVSLLPFALQNRAAATAEWCDKKENENGIALVIRCKMRVPQPNIGEMKKNCVHTLTVIHPKIIECGGCTMWCMHIRIMQCV